MKFDLKGLDQVWAQSLGACSRHV